MTHILRLSSTPGACAACNTNSGSMQPREQEVVRTVNKIVLEEMEEKFGTEFTKSVDAAVRW